MFVEEAVISVVVLVQADGKHIDAVFHLRLHGDQRGKLLDAWRAIGSPEVQYDNLAAQVVQRNRAVGILHGEIGGRPANQAWLSATAAAAGQQKREQESRPASYLFRHNVHSPYNK